ncbi:hypothetical protein [Cryobacterium sp. Y57]|uniref:hypothetical protein n=1 Tax=Cryobacterium sp. Y57 TaxID=2048287 RepID=UPI000CE347DD|nr:hypothetical protein [Cryobacterium sp. Y57]
MDLLLGFALITVSTAIGLVEAVRISGPNRGRQTFVGPTVRQKLLMLGWRMLYIGLLVFGVSLVHKEWGDSAYLIVGIVPVLLLIFALWRNWRLPADA